MSPALAGPWHTLRAFAGTDKTAAAAAAAAAGAAAAAAAPPSSPSKNGLMEH